MFSILPVYLIRILKIPWRIYVIISIWILDFNEAANCLESAKIVFWMF